MTVLSRVLLRLPRARGTSRPDPPSPRPLFLLPVAVPSSTASITTTTPHHHHQDLNIISVVSFLSCSCVVPSPLAASLVFPTTTSLSLFAGRRRMIACTSSMVSTLCQFMFILYFFFYFSFLITFFGFVMFISR